MSDTAPDDAALDEVFEQAYRIRFVEHPRSETPRTLLDVDPSEFASLREAMRLTPGPAGHCMCDGDMLLLLEDMAGGALAKITLHHGQSLRWPEAGTWDAAFADADAFIDWLGARGVAQYVELRAERRAQGRVFDAQRERWLAAAPASLRSGLDALERGPMGLPGRIDDATVDATLARLVQEHGSTPAVARALLSWFGQGAGPFSGYPSYEAVPETLLMRLGTDAVLESVDGIELDLDEALLSGLARFFASWELRRTYRSAIAKVPAELRRRLLAHERARNIGDNRQRLENAFDSVAPAQGVGEQGSGLVCVHPDRAVSEVTASGPTVVAVEGFGLVRFVVGADPVALLEGRPFFASVAVDDRHVYAALINDGTIVRVPLEGGEPTRLAEGRGRPLWLRRRGDALAWNDQPFVTDPVRGPPYSATRTIVCRVSTRGGPVEELATHEGAGWDLAFAGDRLAWVRRPGSREEIVATRGGAIEPLITEFGELDSDGGFVHLASTDEHLIVAVPARHWLRAGVELRRYDFAGTLIERIDFVPGRFNGLDADERGIALIVERGSKILAHAWSRAGRHDSLTVPRQPGPLVKVHAADDGAYFAIGSDVYRLLWP